MQQVNAADKALKMAERAKYDQIWSFPEYRKVSPGAKLVKDALDCFGIDEGRGNGTRLNDYGCGTGRAAFGFKTHGFAVTGLDISKKCLDSDIQGKITFHQACLWDNLPVGLLAQYGFCTDVLEHIPEQKTEAVIFNSLYLSTVGCYYQIANFHDGCGGLLGDGRKLHLTVKPIEWWTERFKTVIAALGRLGKRYEIARADSDSQDMNSIFYIKRI